MTAPKENEGIDEGLSTEDLKSVSGGISVDPYNIAKKATTHSVRRLEPKEVSPQGSGSGLTKADWDRKIRRGGDSDICVSIGEGENCW